MIDKDAQGAAERFMAKLKGGGFTMDIFDEEEFHKMMTTFDGTEIPIEKVDFAGAAQSVIQDMDRLLL